MKVILTALALGQILGPVKERSTREGNERYQEGKLDEALQSYTQAQVDHPEAPELHYNIGNVRANMWQNYTRNFPAGVYNIYMRGANGANPMQLDAASISRARVASGSFTSTRAMYVCSASIACWYLPRK